MILVLFLMLSFKQFFFNSSFSFSLSGSLVPFLEKEMAVHSSILAWRIPWTEEPGEGYSLWSHKESDTTE